MEWDSDDYGSFYSGDSYIILYTWKGNDEIKYDLHFWIGKLALPSTDFIAELLSFYLKLTYVLV